MSKKVLLNENGEALIDNGQALTAELSGAAGVESIGGVDGVITLGTGLTINDHELLATGGGSSYTAGDGIDITNNTISVDNTIARASDIPTVPTKTSDLTNDSGFITSSDIPAIPEKTSDLTNDGSDGTSTYVEADDLATVATSGSYNDLSNKPSIPTVPTNISSFTNDAGYITKSTNQLENYTLSSALAVVATSGAYNDLSGKPTIPTKISDLTDDSDFVESTDLAAVATTGDYDDLQNKPTLFSGSYTDLTDKPDLSIYAETSNLADVATSGDYDDLQNKPTIPTVPTDVSAFNNDAGYATETYVNTAIGNLPEPMIFKGTVGNGGTREWADFPSATGSNKGHTYKVITDHSTAPICIEGDTLISNGSTWVVIPSGDEPSGTVTSVGAQAESGSNLSVSGSPITTSGTITIGVASGYSIPSNTKQGQWDAKSDFSGSYNDLTDKPTIPAAITITTTSGSESVSDGTNTLSFGANAFTNTTIPTSAGDIGAVPTTREINGHALSADITLTATDVGAATTADLAAKQDIIQIIDLS